MDFRSTVSRKCRTRRRKASTSEVAEKGRRDRQESRSFFFDSLCDLCGFSQRTRRSGAFIAEIAKKGRRGHREKQMFVTALPPVLLPEAACYRDHCSSRSSPGVRRVYR